jgi:hypothetical protein
VSDGEIHSEFGGSIADRWMHCPGSVALCREVPKLPGSAHAKEGTTAHGFAQYLLTNMLNVKDLTLDGYPDDMGPAVQDYLDAVYEELALSPDAELYVEKKFTFPNVGDGKEVFGSNDALVYHPSKGRLVVFDYKHGRGVSVGAEDNMQLKFYAAGAVLSHPEWTISEVWLCIVQPRALDVDHAGAVKAWQMDPFELVTFAAELDQGVQRAKEPNAPLTPGSWCRWCDAAGVCPAKERQVLEALTLNTYTGVDHVADTPPRPESVINDQTGAGVERMAKVLAGIEVLQAWANQVRQYAEDHMLAGTLEIPGWKVVEKVGRRKWISDPSQVVGCLSLLGIPEDDITPRKLIGVTEAEKLMKMSGADKETRDVMMLALTTKESSGRTIAPITDRRESAAPITQAFEGLK